MTPDGMGWRARLVDDPQVFSGGGRRLLLYLGQGEESAVTVTHLTGAQPVLLRYARGTWPEVDGEPFHGLWLPEGVAEAIADAVRPAPADEVMLVLQQQLEVERGRVDRILDHHVRTRLQASDRTPHDPPARPS